MATIAPASIHIVGLGRIPLAPLLQAATMLDKKVYSASKRTQADTSAKRYLAEDDGLTQAELYKILEMPKAEAHEDQQPSTEHQGEETGENARKKRKRD